MIVDENQHIVFTSDQPPSYADAFDDFVESEGIKERSQEPGIPIKDDPSKPIYVPEAPRKSVPENLKYPFERTFSSPRNEDGQ